MVVTGDLQQADRPNENGLLEFLGLYNNFVNHRHVDICKFTAKDIERHEAVGARAGIVNGIGCDAKLKT